MRLIAAFLGTGCYKHGRYVWDGDEQVLAEPTLKGHETRFVQAALARMLAPDRFLVFVTPAAEEKHWQGLLDAFAQADLSPPERIRIHNGENVEELSSNFRTIVDALNDPDLLPRRDRPGPEDQVFIDITHGFRSLPFFAGAAISLLKAVRADWPRTRIVYGAWEAGKEVRGLREAPIWDLTYFVDMVDWAQALRLFLKTGRAEDAARIGTEVGNRLSAEWARGGCEGERPQLKDFGAALREFSGHFATVRTGRLLLGDGRTASLADRLLERARAIRDQAGAHLPGLDFVLEDLIAMIEPLAGSPQDLAGPGNAGRVAALAELYRRFERPLQAAMTLREGYINLVARPEAARPGWRNFDDVARSNAEDLAKTRFPEFVKRVGKLRNDLMHAGYRRDPISPQAIARELDAGLAKYRAAAGLPRPFLNISNHPNAEWDEDQRSAALALGQPIRDLPFPEVPAEADETWIQRMADELAAAATALAPAAALVQGEFTLTFALVDRLEKAGVPCYAASSPRLVEPLDENAGRMRPAAKSTRRSFRFTRLRRYRP